MLSIQTEILRLLSKSNEPTYPHENSVVPDALSLIRLPISLKKTILALYELGEATADELSNKTGRLRGMESAYANKLTRMGYVKKKRARKKVLFYIENGENRVLEQWGK